MNTAHMESAPISPEDPFLLQVREIVRKYYSLNPGPSNLASNTKAHGMARRCLDPEKIPTREKLEETWRWINYRLESAAKAEEVLEVMKIRPCKEFSDFDKFNTGMHDAAAHGTRERFDRCWDVWFEKSLVPASPAGCGWPWSKVRN